MKTLLMVLSLCFALTACNHDIKEDRQEQEYDPGRESARDGARNRIERY